VFQTRTPHRCSIRLKKITLPKPDKLLGADGLKLGNLSKTYGSWIEVIFRVAEVGIHEAGEEQAGEGLATQSTDGHR
jgi:hypothetical protein